MEDPKAKGKSFHRSVAPAALLALAFAFVGCAQRQGSGMSHGPKLHIQQVSIDGLGQASPDPVKVKKKVEIVVWESPEGTKLQITFADNPFPQPVICPGGNFCASLLPPEGVEKSYDYTATVTTATASNASDPKLEVVR
jgi:hypothetical protein